MLATCPACLFLLDLVIQVIFFEGYKLVLLIMHFFSFLPLPPSYALISTLFSNIFVLLLV